MPRVSDHSCELQVSPCRLENCEAVFTRHSDRDRHERRHLPYAERPFKCDLCDFRANQKSGLKCHENSVHFKKRIPCRDPHCDRDFSDPSTLSRHMNRRHKSSSKRRLASWADFTSKFRTGNTGLVDVTPELGKFSVTDDHIKSDIMKVERLSPDVSSANVTLHTSPVGRQELDGFSCQRLLFDSSLFSFEPSNTLSPLLAPAAPYQPEWQFQSSSSYFPSGSGVDLPSCSTAMFPGTSLPDMNFPVDLTPCSFQLGVGAYGAPSKAAEQSVDGYFPGLLEISTAEDFRSSFYPGPNNGPPSHVLPNYDAASRSFSDLVCEASQRWQPDTLALNFGFGLPCVPEYAF